MPIVKSDYPIKIETNLYSNKDYTIFLYDFTINQKRYRGLIKPNKNFGKRERISYAKIELHNIKERTKSTAISINITLDNFVNHHYKNLLIGTLWGRKKINYYNKHLKELIGYKKIKEIKTLDIKSYVHIQQQKGLKSRTIFTGIEFLNPIFEECINLELISRNPCKKVSIKRDKTKKLVTNATAKLKEIYQTINKVYSNNPMCKAMFYFALQGRRKSEILNLKWHDVDLINNYYILRHTKNNETQKIHLPKRIKEQLQQLKPLSEYIFTTKNCNKIVNESSYIRPIKAILTYFNFHYCRNIVVSALAEQGTEGIYLSGALGHSDINTINKYLTINYLKGSQKASDLIDNLDK